MGIKHGLSWIGRLDYLEKIVSEKSFAVGFQNTAKEAASSPPPKRPKASLCPAPEEQDFGSF